MPALLSSCLVAAATLASSFLFSEVASALGKHVGDLRGVVCFTVKSAPGRKKFQPPIALLTRERIKVLVPPSCPALPVPSPQQRMPQALGDRAAK